MRFAGWMAVFGLMGMGTPFGFAADAAPSYSKDIQPFLNRYCMDCHKGNRAKAGVNVESYQSLMKGDKRGRSLIIAGKPDTSRLMHTLEGKAKPMPPKKSNQPTAQEIAKLRAWIAAGAKDDSKDGAKPDEKNTGLLEIDRHRRTVLSMIAQDVQRTSDRFMKQWLFMSVETSSESELIGSGLEDGFATPDPFFLSATSSGSASVLCASR